MDVKKPERRNRTRQVSRADEAEPRPVVKADAKPRVRPAQQVVPSATASVESAIAGGAQALRATRRADGTFKTLYVAGPMHTALGLLALSHFDKPPPLAEIQGALESLLATQAADGSFPINQQGLPSRDVTRLVALALERLVENLPAGPMGDRVSEALRRAEVFTETDDGRPASRYYRGVAALLEDLEGKRDQLPNVPWLAPLLRTALRSGLVDLSAPMELMAPTLVILGALQAERQSSWAAKLDAGTGQESKTALLKTIRQTQDDEGSWIYTLVPTALNVIALKLAGESENSPTLKKARAFLSQALSSTTPNAMTATAWDTATVLDVLHRAGTVSTAELSPAVTELLRAQGSDGRWDFTLGGSVGNTDTTAMVVKMLASTTAKLPLKLRGEVQTALERAVDGLVRVQREDGGFSAFEGNAKGKRNARRPHGVEVLRADASDPGVTARVVFSMLTAQEAFQFSPSLRMRLGTSGSFAVDYLRKNQQPNGAWWNRWASGYISAAAFVPLALRVAEASPEGRQLTPQRRFLLEHQNADGGWGETVAADNDPALAGKGPSSPVQTAWAITGLIASMGPDDATTAAAIRRGVAYLENKRGPNGWTNDRPLYTIFPGLEYYDAPQMTTVWVMNALELYRDFERVGPQQAVEALLRPNAAPR